MRERQPEDCAPFRILTGTGIASTVIGALVLLALWIPFYPLVRLSPGFPPARAGTALCLLFAGLGLYAVARNRRKLLVFCAGALLGIALAAALGAAGIRTGIDGLGSAGGLTPNSATCALLVSASLFLAARRRRSWRAPLVGVFGSVICSLAIAVIIGHLANISTAFAWGRAGAMSLQGAVGFLCVGAGVTAFSWIDAGRVQTDLLRWLAVLLDIGVMTVSICLWQALKANEIFTLHAGVQAVADHLAWDVAERMEGQVRSLERMASRWSRAGQPAEAAWEADVSTLAEHYKAVKAVMWFDRNLELRWMAPRGAQQDGWAAEARAAAAGRQPTGPATISTASALPDGTPGLYASVAVTRNGSPAGWLVGRFDFSSSLEAGLNPADAKAHSVALLGARARLAGHDVNQTEGLQFARTAPLRLRNATWTLKVWPKRDWVLSHSSVMDELALLVGFGISVIFGFTVRLAQISRARTKEAERANRELRKTISERLEVEAELRKSEERFRTSVDTMVDGFGIATAIRDGSGQIVDFEIEYVNEAACALNRKTKREMIGSRLSKHMPLPADTELLQDYCKVVETGKPLMREYIVGAGTPEDNTILRAFEIRAAKLGDGIAAAWLDVTERVLAENAQHRFEARYRHLFENVPVGIYRTSPSGEILEANPAIVSLLGYPDLDTLRAANSLKFYAQTADRARFLEMVSRGDGSLGIEVEMRRYDGSIIWVLDRAREIRDHEGRLLYYEGTLEDITARTLATEQIKQSLAEKEMLLKEIHHRVKNNLQVISSLLSLQSGYIKDQEARDLFKESQNRVRSMALIHEKLYQSQDLARVDFAEYIRNLSAFLFRAYTVNPEKVSLRVSATEAPLSIDQAIPCGLIVNELVSNALKHAFPGSRSGEIRISLATRESDYQLTVADDGVGLPHGFDIAESGSLGLQLVSTLTDQLNGVMEVRNGSGSEFELRFPYERSGLRRPNR